MKPIDPSQAKVVMLFEGGVKNGVVFFGEGFQGLKFQEPSIAEEGETPQPARSKKMTVLGAFFNLITGNRVLHPTDTLTLYVLVVEKYPYTIDTLEERLKEIFPPRSVRLAWLIEGKGQVILWKGFEPSDMTHFQEHMGVFLEFMNLFTGSRWHPADRHILVLEKYPYTDQESFHEVMEKIHKGS